MKIYETQLESLICEFLNITTKLQFTKPPNNELGDISLPCFQLSKILKKSPNEIANSLVNSLNFHNHKLIQGIKAEGGYVNFYFNKTFIIQNTIDNILLEENNYGSNGTGLNKKALIEHTSINPNASPHIGRARNALIGDSIVRLLRFEGFEVNTHYFVNDVGKQIAMLVYAATDIDNLYFHDLLNLYIDINQKLKEEPEIESDIFNLLYQFENGNKDIRSQFKKIVDICVKGQTEILSKLNIHYDTFKYESDYIFDDKLMDLLHKFDKTNKLLVDDDGRYVLDQSEYSLPMKKPYLVLTRKDKTSLYPLRDIAYTIDKINANKDNNIIVLGEDQKLYFKQIDAALDQLGYTSPKPVHYSFVLLSDGKMATREGKVVLLEDFMNEAKEKVEHHLECAKRTIDKDNVEKIAYGAVKYAILKVANTKNVTFSWDQALNFEGNAGPYIQYCYARFNSILRNNDYLPSQNIDYSLLSTSIEYDLVKELGNFGTEVFKTLNEFSPHILASYVFNLAKCASTFYHNCPVLNLEDNKLKDARLALVASVCQVIKNALYLLGMEVVEYM